MSAATPRAARAGARRRQRVLLGVLLVAGTVIGARLVELQVVRHEGLAIRAADQARDVLDIPGPRGDLMDRHGRILAISVPTDVLIVEPREIDRAGLAAIERGAGARRGALTLRPDDPWELVTRDCGATCRAAVESLIARGAVPVDAVHWEPGFRRSYPHGTRAAHVLGFVTSDGSTAEGVEQTYSHVLASSGRRFLMLKDADQNVVDQVPAGPLGVEPSHVMLTIDLRIQALLDDELRAAARRHAARRADGIVLDPRTGEVLAMASVPSFDPNRFSKADRSLHRNPAIEHAYEPGSVIKPLTAGVLLDAGAVRGGERVWCEEGTWRIGARAIRDHHPHGRLSLPEIIEVSSNIGIAKLSRRIDAPRFRDALSRFGLGRKTGIDLAGESAGVLRPAADWHGADHESIAFGHAMSTTPLQLATAYGAIANDGIWITPRVKRALGSPSGEWHPGKPGAAYRAVSAESARRVAGWLRRVIDGEDGTGRAASIPNIPVSGKTGTAEKLVGGTYDRTRNVATFAGFAPTDDPRAVVVIAIDEPRRGGRTASTTAAPVFASVMAETLRLMRVGGATLPRRPPRTELAHSGVRADRGTR